MDEIAEPAAPSPADVASYIESQLEKRLSRFQALENVPQVVSSVEMRDIRGVRTGYRITVKNTGSTTLKYKAGSWERERILTYREVWEDNAWRPLGWDASLDEPGHEYELTPNESRQFRVQLSHNSMRRERVLAFFSEDKSDRAGVVVLATDAGAHRGHIQGARGRESCVDY